MRLLLLLLPILFSIVVANECGDSCACWDTCFKKAPNNYEDEYTHIYAMVQAIRGARQAYHVKGTAYLLDSTITSGQTNLWAYQKNLAAIFTMTQPVENCCNPFFMSKYTWWGAYAWFKWNCQCKCEAANTLVSQNAQTLGSWSPQDYLGLGCLIGQILPNYVDCNYGKKTMAIAFNNNKDSAAFSGFCNWFSVRANVALHNSPTPAGFVKADNLPTLDLKSKYTYTLLSASRQLLRCMRSECCNKYEESSYQQIWARKKRAAEEEQPQIFFATKDSGEKVQTSNLDQEEFERTMAEKYGRGETDVQAVRA